MPIVRLYLKLYSFIAKKRIKEGDIPERRIHAFLLTVLVTGVLMWAYFLCAYLTIDHNLPWQIGLLCSLVHLFSPLLFRVSNNLLLLTMIMLSAGYIHQGIFAYFTGGFNSHILIWYGIIPMLAGIIEGKRATFFTATIVSLISITFLWLELSGFNFPNLISANGRLFAQACLVFGWIGVATVLMITFDTMTLKYEDTLNEEKEKTENLLRILLHDISNSATIISNSNRLLKQNTDLEIVQRVFDRIKTHSRVIIDTIVSVKNMHVLEKGKQDLELKEVPFKESLRYVLSYLDSNLKQKDITIKCTEEIKDITLHIDKTIFEHQVLINILSNCIKFSPENGLINIWMTEIPESDDGKINIHIKDNGIGIPDDILENLFSPQYKTSRPGTNNEKGTGLGMIIMKSMLQKMNGDVAISSSTKGINKGTEFILSLQASTHLYK